MKLEIQQNDKLGRGFLFGGLLAARVLPYILHSILLLVTKRSLGNVSYELCNAAGIVCAIVFLYFGVAHMGFTRMKDYLSCGVFLLLAVVLGEFSERILLLNVASWFVQHAWVTVLISVLVALGIAFLGALAVLNGLRRPPVMLLTMLMCIGFSCVGLLIEWLVAVAVPFMSSSFVSNILIFALTSLAEALILYGALLYARKATNRWEIKDYRFERRTLPALAISVILVAIMGIAEATEQPEEPIIAELQETFALGDAYLIQQNIDMAQVYYEKAFGRIAAYQCALGAEYDSSLLTSIVDKRQDLQTSFICWENQNNRNAIGEYLLYEDVQLELAVKYLDMLPVAEEELSARETAFREDIVKLMISYNKFRDEAVSLKDLEGREEVVLEKLETFDAAKPTYQVVSLLTKTGRAGEVTLKDVNKMLDYADANTDNLYIQYLAVLYGNALKSDSQEHYERTINVARRYERLYAQTEGVTKEDILNCQMTVAQWCIEMADYSTALSYLEPIVASERKLDAIGMATRCYSELEETEKCREMAELLLEEQPDNASALFYCGLIHLKNGEIDKTVEYSVKLAEAFERAQGEDKHQAEVCLYALLQYMAVRDSAVGYTYNIYSELTEEQRAVISANQTLDNYMKAVYFCFGKKNYEEAMSCVNAVLETQGELSQARYLQGCIYFGMKDYENAVNSYQASLAVESDSPTVWYALANSYDALEKYEEAYEACLKVEMLLPGTDHEFDWYGVSIHNGRLMDALERELGR